MQSPKRNNLNGLPRDGKYKNASEVLPVRLNVLLGISMLLLALLVIQLAMLQIVRGNNFRAEVNRNDEVIEYTKVPRGLMYDSTGRVLVGNKAEQAITYTRALGTTVSDIYKTAKHLSKYLTVDTDKLTKQTQIDYYLQTPKAAKEMPAKLNMSKQTYQQMATSAPQKLNDKEVAYLKKHHFKLTSDSDLNAAMLFQKMSGAYLLSTVTLKNEDVTDQEFAEIGERLSKLNGVKIGTTWQRDYPQGKDVQSLLGTVTTPSIGLPADRLKTFLAKGYSQDESVGVSSLEDKYESTLRGSSKKVRLTLGNNNQVLSQKTLYAGQAGDDLNLSINSDFQNEVQNILKQHMSGPHNSGAYATVINPYTGSIYAMAGWTKDSDTGELKSDALGSIQKSIIMGSAIKPAMVANALQRKVITPDSSTLVDQTIKIKGTKDINSFFNKDGVPTPLTAQQALEVSSNTYMVQLALKMGGTGYTPGMGLFFQNDIWTKLRNGFAQFGLGDRTGVDLPGESAAFLGPTQGTEYMGKALYEAFGNYDSYTVIQMARYVSAIANGGKLIRPHVVNSISSHAKSGKQSNLLWSAKPQVQGSVKLTEAQWQVIREGMWDMANGSMTGNTGGEAMHSLDPPVAAKSGTAETTTDGVATTTASLILFVPGQPVALAIAYPGVPTDQFGSATDAGHDIMEAYWKYVQKKPTNYETIR